MKMSGEQGLGWSGWSGLVRRASCFDEVGEVWSGGAGARAAPMRAARANSQEALRDERYGHGRELLREERLLGVACANSTAASAKRTIF